MSEQDTPEKKLKKLTGSENLSTAIEKLERKKASMEDDFKDGAHYFLENLNPVKVLDTTIQNVIKSSSSNYSLFKEALALGAGYLSKRKLIHQFKRGLISTFRIQANVALGKTIAANNKQEENEIDESEHPEKIQPVKKSKEMNLQDQMQKVKAKPELLPEPTYWPFFLAMGISFLGWGLLTTWLISLAGFIIIIVSLTGWINILRHE